MSGGSTGAHRSRRGLRGDQIVVEREPDAHQLPIVDLIPGALGRGEGVVAEGAGLEVRSGVRIECSDASRVRQPERFFIR